MAEHIRGTVIEGEYSSTLISGPADRPEDPSKWKVVRLKDAEICKRLNKTAAQLKTARAFLGFPVGQVVSRTKPGSFVVERYTVTNEKDVAQWEEHAREVGLLK